MKQLYLQSENRRKDIHFYVNSPGGDVSATLAIYDTMQMISCPICTYCVGQAASGAAVLLGAAARANATACQNSRVMLHQPYGGVQGQISDIEIQANEILRYRNVLNDILASTPASRSRASPKTPTVISSSGAEEAKKYGLVDDILQKMPGAEEEKD